MPTYTYHCEQCDHEFDQHQSFKEAALSVCPVCKQSALYKVYKPAQVVFKGSGYYVTDSRAKSSTLTSGAESASPDPKNGKSGAKEPGKKKEVKKKSEKSTKSTSKSSAAD
jgi:putative FmdB family regulatory protein